MNEKYSTTDVVNPSEEIYSKPAGQDTTEDGRGGSSLEIVATRYADLLWKLYWHKKLVEREAKSNFDNMNSD